MKPQNKSAIWNIREQKTPNQKSKKKKVSQEMKIVQGASGTISSISTFTFGGCQKEKESKKLKTY